MNRLSLFIGGAAFQTGLDSLREKSAHLKREVSIPRYTPPELT